MKSIDIITARKSIKDYLDSTKLPKEVIRLMLKELYEEIKAEALNEAMEEAQDIQVVTKQIKEEEANDCDNIGINIQAEEEKG